MAEQYYQPQWADSFSEQLLAAESRRTGGQSSAPYTSLNLGLYTNDKVKDVAANRQTFCAALGITPAQLAGGHQVHASEVLAVSQGGQWTGYDAFITQEPGVVLSVTVADCCPVLFFDPVHGAVGVAHAGWKGTVAEIARKTLTEMQQAYNTQAADCWAYVGTCIGRDDFEVDADVADHFAPAYKHWDDTKGKFLVDLKKANKEQLLNAGLCPEQLEVSPYSTVRNNELYFSHRAEKGTTGRLLAVIGLK